MKELTIEDELQELGKDGFDSYYDTVTLINRFGYVPFNAVGPYL